MERGPALLEMTVYGKASPAGSKTADPVMRRGPNGPVPVLKGGRPIVRQRHARKSTKPWMDLVAKEAAIAWGGQVLLDGAVWVDIEVYEPRPQAHYRTGKYSHLLRPGAPAYPHRTNSGDSGKLRRAIEDALTGVVWRDDKLVVSGSDQKHYGDPARAVIRAGLLVAQTVADLGLAEVEPEHPEAQETLIAA